MYKNSKYISKFFTIKLSFSFYLHSEELLYVFYIIINGKIGKVMM